MAFKGLKVIAIGYLYEKAYKKPLLPKITVQVLHETFSDSALP